MTPRGRMSENEKIIFGCVLFFPIGWLLLLAILPCMAAEKIRDAYWAWKYRREDRKRQNEDREGLT